METRASYLAVAAFVLVLLLGGSGFIAWTVRSGDRGAVVDHYVRIAGSVAGLGVGSGVQYGGIPIGHVTSIAIDAEDPSLTRINIAVRADVPIRPESTATLQSKSLIGGMVVEITRSASASPPVPPGAEIRAGASSWERLLTSAPRLMTKSDQLFERLDLFLDPRNGAALVRAMASFDRIKAAMDRNAGRLDRLLADTDRALAHAGAAGDEASKLMAELKRSGASLSADADKALAGMEGAGNALARTRDALALLVEENKRALHDFETTGYPQIPAMFAELREASRRLSHLWSEIRQDPTRFFLDDRQSGFSPP